MRDGHEATSRPGRQIVDWTLGPAPRELLARAIESLTEYKLRTGLSVLGVVLGVAAVIAMMSVSEGARADALEQVDRLGLDNIVVRSRMPASATPANGPTIGDAHRLAALVPLARTASAVVDRFVPVSQGGHAVAASVLGVESSYGDILGLSVSHGRWLSQIEDQSAATVCVLGEGLARKLFGFAPAIGGTVRVQRQYFHVIGVLQERVTTGRSLGALAGRNLNEVMLVPLTALTQHTTRIDPNQPVDEIWLQVRDGLQVEAASQVLTRTLSQLHRGETTFDVIVPRELLAQRYRTQRTFAVVVGSVAFLALLVSGIGIMNSMLTAVMERTHEIGLRRAVGATRRDVGRQFLVESLLMTLGGGLIGIVIGVAVAWGITAYAGWTTRVSILAVVLGFVVSATVGLAFGFFPAIKAGRLEPVDALHYE